MILRVGHERIHVVLKVMVSVSIITVALRSKALHVMAWLIHIDQGLEMILDLGLVLRGRGAVGIRTHFHILVIVSNPKPLVIRRCELLVVEASWNEIGVRAFQQAGLLEHFYRRGHWWRQATPPELLSSVLLLLVCSLVVLL